MDLPFVRYASSLVLISSTDPPPHVFCPESLRVFRASHNLFATLRHLVQMPCSSLLLVVPSPGVPSFSVTKAMSDFEADILFECPGGRAADFVFESMSWTTLPATPKAVIGSSTLSSYFSTIISYILYLLLYLPDLSL